MQCASFVHKKCIFSAGSIAGLCLFVGLRSHATHQVQLLTILQAMLYTPTISPGSYIFHRNSYKSIKLRRIFCSKLANLFTFWRFDISTWNSNRKLTSFIDWFRSPDTLTFETVRRNMTLKLRDLSHARKSIYVCWKYSLIVIRFWSTDPPTALDL